jgi:hypothetical protein
LYDLANLLAAQTLQEIALATRAIDNAADHQVNLSARPIKRTSMPHKRRWCWQKTASTKPREDFEPYENKPDDNLIRAALLSKKAAAQDYYDTLVTRYNNLIGEAERDRPIQCRGGPGGGKCAAGWRQRRYDQSKTGRTPTRFLLPKLAWRAPRHTWMQRWPIKPGTITPLPDADRQRPGGFERNADSTTETGDKCPMDGIVLERLIEPGEVASLSTPLLSLAIG